MFESKRTMRCLNIFPPELYYATKHSGGYIADPINSVKKLVSKLRESDKPDLIVLLTHMKQEKAMGLLALDGIDVLVNGHIEKDTDLIDMNPIKQNGKIFVQPGERGQKMGELTVHIDTLGRKIFKHRIVRLDSNIKFDPEMIKWYEEYNKEIEGLFFASLDARKKNGQKNKVYASQQICLSCHQNKHETWKKSRHAHAYETLDKVNKAFDPECLKCHVTGFDQIGGFISEVDTPALKNVQCEVCHGPMLKHSKNPKANSGRNALVACKDCHVKNHSPKFNFTKYWPKIKH